MLLAWCPKCNGRVQVRVYASLNWDAGESSPPEDRQIGSCVGCDAPVIIGRVIYNSDWIEEFPVYPPDQFSVNFMLPSKVQHSHSEALRCRTAGAYTACVVMVRRCLEAVAKEYDPKTRTAFTGLAAMRDAGVISGELHEWADQLRMTGNAGAHATDEVVTKADAEDALAFLHSILETLYHFRPRFQAMKARRSAAAAGPE